MNHQDVIIKLDHEIYLQIWVNMNERKTMTGKSEYTELHNKSYILKVKR